MWQSLRTVKLETGIDQEVDKLSDDLDRFKDAYIALEWMLARRPEKGKTRTVNGITWNVYVQGSDSIAQSPGIWVLYQFDDDEVTIFGIKAVPFHDDPET